MKRFTETTKWNDPWYRRLPSKQKNFWQYICDNCNNAGVWKIDFEAASFHVGEIVCMEEFEAFNEGKDRVVVLGPLLIIIDFIPFQIGNLNGKKLTNLQKNCIDLLEAYSRKDIDVIKYLPVSYLKRSGIGIGKGKGIGKGRDKDKYIRPPHVKENQITNVRITEDQLKSVLADYEKRIVIKYLTDLDGYIDQIGVAKADAKYSCHVAVIRNWMRRDGVKKKLPEVKNKKETEKRPDISPEQAASVRKDVDKLIKGIK